jgi:hypothetical protein
MADDFRFEEARDLSLIRETVREVAGDTTTPTGAR